MFGFTEPEVLLEVAPSSGGAVGAAPDPLARLLRPLQQLFERGSADPFYAVVAYRNFRREDV